MLAPVPAAFLGNWGIRCDDQSFYSGWYYDTGGFSLLLAVLRTPSGNWNGLPSTPSRDLAECYFLRGGGSRVAIEITT